MTNSRRTKRDDPADIGSSLSARRRTTQPKCNTTRTTMQKNENSKSSCIGVMVWCLACETVVWALDSDVGDLRGILNMLSIPCRLCGVRGNYDQYSANANHMDVYGAYDGWSTMKALADYEELEWNPSPDNTWRSDAEIEGATMDLHTIDLDHDLGVRDLTDPITGEVI